MSIPISQFIPLPIPHPPLVKSYLFKIGFCLSYIVIRGYVLLGTDSLKFIETCFMAYYVVSFYLKSLFFSFVVTVVVLFLSKSFIYLLITFLCV